MSVIVRPVDPEAREWRELVGVSHQTSLFVSPEWLAAERPLIIGAFDKAGLTTGLVAHDVSEYPLLSPYQGLIQSGATRPAAVEALLDWVEGVGGAPAIWNAPSMVDIRPFQERMKRGRFWTTHIRYTFFVEGHGEAPLPESCDKTEERFQRLGVTRVARRCFEAENVKFYEDETGLVAWGEDAQRRGYLLGGDGRAGRLVQQLVAAYPSVDLNGTHEWARPMKPKLRTSYGLVLKPNGNSNVRAGEDSSSSALR